MFLLQFDWWERTWLLWTALTAKQPHKQVALGKLQILDHYTPSAVYRGERLAKSLSEAYGYYFYDLPIKLLLANDAHARTLADSMEPNTLSEVKSLDAV